MILAWLAAGASSQPLLTEDVWSSVSATHPLLTAARTRAGVAEDELRAASGAFDPTLSARATTAVGDWSTQSAGVKAPLATLWGADLSAGWQRGVGEFEPYEGAYKTADPGEWVVGFDVALLRDAWTDRRRATRAAAQLGLGVADADVRQRELELLRAAGHRWVDWEVAGQRLRVAERLVELAEVRDRALALQQELGEVPPLVRLDNTRLVLERRERAVQARRAFEQASIELSTWLRDADGRPILAPEALLLPSFVPPEAPAPLDELLARAPGARPELARLQAQSAAASVERRLQVNQALPAVDLVGKSSFPLDPKYDVEHEVGVVTEWTALSRTARARASLAGLALERLGAEAAFARDRVEADVRDARSAWEAASARVELARSLVDTAREVEAGERAKFELGDSNLIFVNQRELASADAELVLLDAVAAAHRSRIDVAWAAGDLASP